MQVAAKTDSVAKQTPEFRGAEIKCVPHLMHPPIHDVRGHVVHIHEMSCHVVHIHESCHTSHVSACGGNAAGRAAAGVAATARALAA